MSGVEKLAHILASMENKEDIKNLLLEILTESEIKDLSLRWQLMEELFAGVPQRKISADLGISLCKITRGSKILKKEDSLSRKILEKKYNKT